MPEARTTIIGIMLTACSASPAMAQQVAAPGGFAPVTATGYGAPGTPYTPVTATTPLPVASKQESYSLAAANVAAAAQTVYGGSYIITQACSTYGTITIRYRGPDGVTMATLLTRSAADTGGGTLVSLGSSAIVDVILSGTAGCAVAIARVP